MILKNLRIGECFVSAEKNKKNTGDKIKMMKTNTGTIIEDENFIKCVDDVGIIHLIPWDEKIKKKKRINFIEG